ncbi:UNVERIFIED_CONTAM: hypothetical protein Sindi_2019600 [Sesamum indicum]
METPEIRQPVEKTTLRKVEARIMEKKQQEKARIGEKAGTSLAEKERRSATEIDGKIWQPKQDFLEDEKLGALNTLAVGVSLETEGRSDLMETSGSNLNEKGGSLATGSMEIEVPPFLGFSSSSIHGGRKGVSSPHDFNISEFLCLANKVVDNGDTAAMEALEGLKNLWEEKYDNGGSKKSATNLPFGRNPIKARRGSFSPVTENENSALAGFAGDEEADGWFWQEDDGIWGEPIEKNGCPSSGQILAPARKSGHCISDDVIAEVTFADVMANVTPVDDKIARAFNNSLTPGKAMRKLKHTQAPIWIKLRHLPMEYWTTEGLSIVASGVGKPLYPDAIKRCETGLRSCMCDD